jgi:hypothetical protein
MSVRPASHHVEGDADVLDAGCFQPEISSFRLHLAAEDKAARTARTYTEAVQWFATAHLRPVAGRAGWEEVRRQDVQEWIVAAEAVQRRVCQQPVPRPAAVLTITEALQIFVIRVILSRAGRVGLVVLIIVSARRRVLRRR